MILTALCQYPKCAAYAPQPLRAAAIAEKLEVTARTTYRDIAALQASRVPIEGALGLGLCAAPRL